MSKRITKASLRRLSDEWRMEGMEHCIKCSDVSSNSEPRKWASLKERAETLRRVANELDSILEGEMQ